MRDRRAHLASASASASAQPDARWASPPALFALDAARRVTDSHASPPPPPPVAIGWSSYSEVAAYWGGEGGKPVPMLMAGRDFGLLVDTPIPAAAPVAAAKKSGPDSEFVLNLDEEPDPDEDESHQMVAREDGAETLQRNWPKPFGSWGEEK